MVFKGTEKLNSFQVNEAFDRTGAQFNAFTGEEATVFYAAILPEYLTEITGLWIDLMRPSLRTDDFNIEKNVIKEEIAMYNDSPSFDVSDRCRKLYFQNHPCGYSVLGSNETIDNMTAEQMRAYFGKRYAPNNMIMTVVGNFDWEQICSFAESGCGGWQKHAVTRLAEDYHGGTFKERIERPNLNCEHICLMSPCVSAHDPRRFAASLLATIVGDDVGSRFFWELVDKAIAETATMHYGGMDGTGLFYSYIRCSGKNVAKSLDIVADIFRKLAQKGVRKSEITAAKNKILSALVIKNETPMGRLVDVGFNWMYLGQYRTLEDDIKAIKAVTADDIHSLIEQFTPGQFTQFSIGPAQSR